MKESTTQASSQIEELAAKFGLTTYRFLEASQQKAELARAAGDREELIKDRPVRFVSAVPKPFAAIYWMMLDCTPVL